MFSIWLGYSVNQHLGLFLGKFLTVILLIYHLLCAVHIYKTLWTTYQMHNLISYYLLYIRFITGVTTWENVSVNSEFYYPTHMTFLRRWIFCFFPLLLTVFPHQTSPWSEKNESCRGSKGQLVSVHSGGSALPHPGGLHPLLSSPQSLLGGPSAEDEGLWPQYSHDVGSHCNLTTWLSRVFTVFCCRRSNTDQIRSNVFV